MAKDDWITTAEAVEISGYTLYHVRYLLNTGKVKGQKWGRSWQVSRSGLLAHIRKAEKLGAKRGPKTTA
jgi:hypothetical protein